MQDGMPSGLMIGGRHFDEAMVLAVGYGASPCCCPVASFAAKQRWLGSKLHSLAWGLLRQAVRR